MSVAAICRAVRDQWEAWAQLIWPETTEQRTEAEIERLMDELARRYRGLVQRRRRIEQLRERLAGEERQLAEHDSTAEPDLMGQSLRDVIERTREKLTWHEQAYAHKRRVLELRKRLHKEMLHGKVVVAEDAGDE